MRRIVDNTLHGLCEGEMGHCWVSSRNLITGKSIMLCKDCGKKRGLNG